MRLKLIISLTLMLCSLMSKEAFCADTTYKPIVAVLEHNNTTVTKYIKGNIATSQPQDTSFHLKYIILENQYGGRTTMIISNSVDSVIIPDTTSLAKFAFGGHAVSLPSDYKEIAGGGSDNPTSKVFTATQNGITISTVSTSVWGDNAGTGGTGAITGDNSGIRPDAVLRGFLYYSTSTLTDTSHTINPDPLDNIQISGLNAGSVYDIKVGADRNKSDGVTRITFYKVQGETKSLETSGNLFKEVEFNHVIADESGVISFRLFPSYPQGGGAGFAYIGWLEISIIE